MREHGLQPLTVGATGAQHHSLHFPRSAAQGIGERRNLTALVFAGEGVNLIHDIEPAAGILKRIVTEGEAALAQRFD
jgi:hypothetical protein